MPIAFTPKESNGAGYFAHVVLRGNFLLVFFQISIRPKVEFLHHSAIVWKASLFLYSLDTKFVRSIVSNKNNETERTFWPACSLTSKLVHMTDYTH